MFLGPQIGISDSNLGLLFAQATELLGIPKVERAKGTPFGG